MNDELGAAAKLVRERLGTELRETLDAGGAFAANLFTYLRQRERPRLLFSPERLADIARAAHRRDPEESGWEQEIADNAVAGRLYAASNTHCRRFLDVHTPDFDFSQIDHFDPQAIHGLNRHRWLASLARTFWLTGDQGYLDALFREWDFFVERVPFPGEEHLRGVHAIGRTAQDPPFSELDTFIRLTNWYFAYWLALHAEAMTPERNLVLLARCLRQFDLVAARGVRIHRHNFTSMQMEALYLWAAALPEFTGMTVWKHAARNTLEGSLAAAVWPDGVQWEKSASYHVGCIRWYGTSYLLGLRNGEPWAEEYGERLKAMGHYLDAIVTPDGKTPLLSDSDRTVGWAAGLALLRCIIPDLTFRRPVAPTYFSLWVSDGSEWGPAAARDPDRGWLEVFPQGGVGVAATSAGPGACMAILDNGPTVAGHSHADNLTVHFEALGRPVIVDPGRWIYRGDADRQWVTGAHAHNTLVRDGLRPVPWAPPAEAAFDVVLGPEDTRMGPIESAQEQDFARLATSFHGYVGNPAAQARREVHVSRQEDAPWLVIVDHIEDTEESPWTNAWLIPGSVPLERHANGFVLQAEGGIGVGLGVYPHDMDVQDDAMFWCPNYGEKSPARWIRFSARGKRMTRVFAFIPSIGAVRVPRIESAEVASVLSAVKEVKAR